MIKYYGGEIGAQGSLDLNFSSKVWIWLLPD